MKVLVLLVALLTCVTVASYYHSFGVQRWNYAPGRLQLLTLQVQDGIMGVHFRADDTATPVRIPPTPVRYTLMIDAGYLRRTTRRRRLDFHALRHTCSTNLDKTGCSRATRKKIERRAAQDTTDGYAHAELAEMLTVLERLPSPLNDWNAPRRAVAVAGLAGPAGDASAARDHGRDQAMCFVPHGTSLTDTSRMMPFQESQSGLPVVNQGIDARQHALSSSDLIGAGNRDNVLKIGPSTQVD